MRRKWSQIICYTLFSVTFLLIYRFSQKLRNEMKPPDGGVEERMAKRLHLVSSTCKKYNIGAGVSSSLFLLKHHPPAPQYSVFYFNREKKLAYCPVYKAASTSMLHWLLAMKGIGTEDIAHSSKQISDVARQFYPSVDYPEADKILSKSLMTFMIVRHPFERLLSAYRDKLSNSTINREHGTLHFYEKYGKKIVKKYRPKDSSLIQVEPTFEEFVLYLIGTDLMHYADDHWIPYYLFCTPCLVHYDVYVHFETLRSDFMFLLDRMDRNSGDDSVITRPEWKHATTGGYSNKALLKSYFSQLKRSTLVKLYEKFRLDFELFGYDVEEYLALARIE